MIKKIEKEKVIKDFRINDEDTGSTEVQIALLSKHINMLTKHLQDNPKDFSSKRGLLKSVGRRKRYLTYLHKKDDKKYKTLIKRLSLRH